MYARRKAVGGIERERAGGLPCFTGGCTAAFCASQVRDGELLPADLLLLRAWAPEGVAFVRTTNLDGETNLKVRRNVQLPGWDELAAASPAGEGESSTARARRGSRSSSAGDGSSSVKSKGSIHGNGSSRSSSSSSSGGEEGEHPWDGGGGGSSSESDSDEEFHAARVRHHQVSREITEWSYQLCGWSR
jgi:hypothetical protein